MVPVQSGEDWIGDDLSQPAEISGDSFRISALQREDPVCITLHAWIVADEFPTWAEVKSMLPELRSLWHHRNNLSVDATVHYGAKEARRAPFYNYWFQRLAGNDSFYLIMRLYTAVTWDGHGR